MDPKRVDGTNNPQLPASISKKGLTDTLAELVTSSEVKVETKKVPEIEIINFSTHPNFFNGLRKIIQPVEGLRAFIKWQKSKQEDLFLFECIKDALRVDPSIKGTTEDLILSFSKRNIDLISKLKTIFIKSNDFEEKLVIVKTLFSQDQQDDFIYEFLIPVLEKNTKIDNLENNHTFSIQFLSLIEQKDQEKILEVIDYNTICNISNFAKSLIQAIDPVFVMDNLMKKAETIKINEFELTDGENKRVNELEKIQLLILAILQTLDETKKPLPHDHTETLYRKAVNCKIRNKVSLLLKKHFQVADSSTIFKEEFLNNSELNNTHRKNRFYAIGHYTDVAGENAFPALKKFLLEEEDPFLISYACNNIVKSCGLDGKRALINIIVNQVRGERPSYVLAAVTQMSKYDEVYVDILKGVFIKTFTSDKDLRQAYLKLLGVPKIYKKDSGALSFYLEPDESNDLVIDLLNPNSLGFKTLVNWATGIEGKTPEIRMALRKNAMDILDLACKVNKETITNLFLETLTIETEEELQISKKLAGISNFGKDLD